MAQHPFDALRDRALDWQELGEQAYDTSRCEFLIKTCRLQSYRSALLERAANETGERRLKLEIFNGMFTGFPLFLGSSRLGGVKLHLAATAMLPALFRSFCRSPFFEAYESFYEESVKSAGDRPIGLVFPRKGLKQGLIIHNGDMSRWRCRGLVMSYYGDKDAEPLYVQPFQTLVEAVYAAGHGWKPD